MDFKPSCRRDVFLNFQSSVISGSWLFLFFFAPFFFFSVLFLLFFPVFSFYPSPVFAIGVCEIFQISPSSMIRDQTRAHVQRHKSGVTSINPSLPEEAQSRGKGQENHPGDGEGREEQQDPLLSAQPPPASPGEEFLGQEQHKGSAGTPIPTLEPSTPAGPRPVTALGVPGGSSLEVFFSPSPFRV